MQFKSIATLTAFELLTKASKCAASNPQTGFSENPSNLGSQCQPLDLNLNNCSNDSFKSILSNAIFSTLKEQKNIAGHTECLVKKLKSIVNIQNPDKKKSLKKFLDLALDAIDPERKEKFDKIRESNLEVEPNTCVTLGGIINEIKRQNEIKSKLSLARDAFFDYLKLIYGIPSISHEDQMEFIEFFSSIHALSAYFDSNLKDSYQVCLSKPLEIQSNDFEYCIDSLDTVKQDNYLFYWILSGFFDYNNCLLESNILVLMYCAATNFSIPSEDYITTWASSLDEYLSSLKLPVEAYYFLRDFSRLRKGAIEENEVFAKFKQFFDRYYKAIEKCKPAL